MLFCRLWLLAYEPLSLTIVIHGYLVLEWLLIWVMMIYITITMDCILALCFWPGRPSLTWKMHPSISISISDDDGGWQASCCIAPLRTQGVTSRTFLSLLATRGTIFYWVWQIDKFQTNIDTFQTDFDILPSFSGAKCTFVLISVWICCASSSRCSDLLELMLSSF